MVNAVEHISKMVLWLLVASCTSILLWGFAHESNAESATPAPEVGRDAGAPTRGTIEIHITGLANDQGKACASLYDNPEGYPRDPAKAAFRECSSIHDKRATITFEDLPFGTYASFAFHDADDNGEIRKNRLGIPRDPVGASNKARGRFGPPSFEDASFQHTDARTIVPIEVRGI